MSSSVKVGVRSRIPQMPDSSPPAIVLPYNSTSCSFAKDVFWPSQFTVLAASRNNFKLRLLRSGRRENPIDKNSLLSPWVRSASCLHSLLWSQFRALSLKCRTRGHPALTVCALGSTLPALFHRLFPRSTWLSGPSLCDRSGRVGVGASETDPTAQLPAPAGAEFLHGLQPCRGGPYKVLGAGVPGSREHGGGPRHGGGSCSPSSEGLWDWGELECLPPSIGWVKGDPDFASMKEKQGHVWWDLTVVTLCSTIAEVCHSLKLWLAWQWDCEMFAGQVT